MMAGSSSKQAAVHAAEALLVASITTFLYQVSNNSMTWDKVTITLTVVSTLRDLILVRDYCVGKISDARVRTQKESFTVLVSSIINHYASTANRSIWCSLSGRKYDWYDFQKKGQFYQDVMHMCSAYKQYAAARQQLSGGTASSASLLSRSHRTWETHFPALSIQEQLTMSHAEAKVGRIDWCRLGTFGENSSSVYCEGMEQSPAYVRQPTTTDK